MPEQKTQTFRGTVESVKNVNTRSGRKMITFEIASYPFKAFGEQAGAIEQIEGQHVEITAKHNTFHGKDEYAVVTIAGEVHGQRVAATDTSRSLIASSAAPQRVLNHPDRPHWNSDSCRSNAKAYEVCVWLNRFIGSLTEDEWRQWQTYWDNRWPRTDAENDEIARIDEEIKLTKEKESGPFNSSLHMQMGELWHKRNSVGKNDDRNLERVKARFNARLDIVREDLRRKTTAQVSKAGFTPIDDSAPNCP
jgi:hypothetical protein